MVVDGDRQLAMVAMARSATTVDQGATKVEANGSCKGARRRRSGSGKGALLAGHVYGEHKAARRVLGGVERRVRDGEECARALPISSGAGRRGGTRVGHGGGAASSLKTRGHEVEQVAGVIHPILEDVPGLLTGRTGLWSLKQSCSSPDALQPLFRMPVN